MLIQDSCVIRLRKEDLKVQFLFTMLRWFTNKYNTRYIVCELDFFCTINKRDLVIKYERALSVNKVVIFVYINYFASTAI